VIDPRLEGEILITLIATGFGEARLQKPVRFPAREQEDVPQRSILQPREELPARRAVGETGRPSVPFVNRRLPDGDNIDIPTFLRRRG